MTVLDASSSESIAGRRQRIDSAAAVASATRDRASVLATLDQRGGAKIRLPRSGGDALEAVLVNTAGGLTGGDRIDWRGEAGAGSRLVLTSAASEKVYRSEHGDARQLTTLRVGPGARLDWLPQETILFDGGRLARALDVELASDATLLAVEALVIGRTAMGERVVDGALQDRWRIHRDGRLLHAEAVALDAARDLRDRSPAGFGSRYRAVATAVLCSPLPEETLGLLAGRVAAVLPTPTAWRPDRTDDPPADASRAAVSVLPGRLVLRGVATDGQRLRTWLLPALEVLAGRGLPRVWRV